MEMNSNTSPVQSSSGTETLLRVAGLSKRYPGFELNDVSFYIDAGTITGFIGRNGAGKSTTLKSLEGAVHPDGGVIEYFGKPFAGNERSAKLQTGFGLGEADYYRTKRLSTIAKVTQGFYPNWDATAYAEYCRLFDLDQGKRIMDLSQGMRVKFTLALALSHRSKLLVLDEPTSGLDPASREEVLDILLGLAREHGVGVLFSTHITSDLDKCADRIIYLRDGRVVGQGPLGQFKARYEVASLDEARAYGAEVLGVRRTAQGDTALVPASAGIGEPATLDDIMTHTVKEVQR